MITALFIVKESSEAKKETGIPPASCVEAIRLERCHSLIHRIIDLNVLRYARHIQHFADVWDRARQLEMLCPAVGCEHFVNEHERADADTGQGGSLAQVDDQVARPILVGIFGSLLQLCVIS